MDGRTDRWSKGHLLPVSGQLLANMTAFDQHFAKYGLIVYWVKNWFPNPSL